MVEHVGQPQPSQCITRGLIGGKYYQVIEIGLSTLTRGGMGRRRRRRELGGGRESSSSSSNSSGGGVNSSSSNSAYQVVC